MSVLYHNKENGTEAFYMHEKFILVDKDLNQCLIRCSFDKDNFFLRSASMVVPCENFEGNKSFKTVRINKMHITEIGKNESYTLSDKIS